MGCLPTYKGKRYNSLKEIEDFILGGNASKVKENLDTDVSKEATNESQEIETYFEGDTVLKTDTASNVETGVPFKSERHKSDFLAKVVQEIKDVKNSNLSKSVKDDLLNELNAIKESIETKPEIVEEEVTDEEVYGEEVGYESNPIDKSLGFKVQLGNSVGLLGRTKDGIYFIQDENGNGQVIEGAEGAKSLKSLGVKVLEGTKPITKGGKSKERLGYGKGQKIKKTDDKSYPTEPKKLYQGNSIKNRLLDKRKPKQTLNTDVSTRESLEKQITELAKSGKIKATPKQIKAAFKIYDAMAKTYKAVTGKDNFWDKFGVQLAEGVSGLKQEAQMFKSTALEGLGKINQKAAKPEAWVKMISEKGGRGTSQELNWIGLSDFLKDYMKENKVKSVPKDVVEQYIKDNQIEIVEVGKTDINNFNYSNWKDSEQKSDFDIQKTGRRVLISEDGYKIIQDKEGGYDLFSPNGEKVVEDERSLNQIKERYNYIVKKITNQILRIHPWRWKKLPRISTYFS
jgi:CRISPR/Cas system CMR-associated protein Cmr5 small subunit